MNTLINIKIEMLYQNFVGGMIFTLIFLFLYWRSKKEYLKPLATFWILSAIFYLSSIFIYIEQFYFISVIAYILSIILAGFFLLKGIHEFLSHNLNKFWSVSGAVAFVISSISALVYDNWLITLIVIMIYFSMAYLKSGIMLFKQSNNLTAKGSGLVAITVGIIIFLHPFIFLDGRYISVVNIFLGGLGALWGFGLIAIHYQDLITETEKEKLKADALFENSTTAIAMLDDRGNIINFNDKFERVFGYTLTEIKGEHIDDVLEKSKKGFSNRQKTEEILQGNKIRGEGTRFDKDGKAREFLYHGVPIIINGAVEGMYVLYDDITEIKKHKRKLELTKFSVDKADLLIFRADPEGNLLYANETSLTKLGYDKSELIGKNGEIFLPDENYITREKFWEKIKESDSLTYEREFIKSNKEKFPVEITSQYYNYDGEEYEYVFVKDISERKEKEKEIKNLLYRDPLTNLFNRRYMEEEIKRLDTKRQLPISIIMLDVNGLKVINDSLGHEKGDELLIKTADILSKAVRDEDILARYGGDEFAILLPQTNKKESDKIIKRIDSECQKTVNNEFIVSLGIGSATKTEINENIFDTLKKADDNMYQNKLMSSESRKHEIVEGLINALGAKSDETKEHAERMTILAHQMAENIDLTNIQRHKLSLLASLHDIGKISVSEKILNKSGELTEEEWEIIKRHPENGYKIASSSTEFAVVAEEILFHHERWDGSGYPKGLKGDEIPLLSRIISIIDAYDVMTHDRLYSSAISKEEALKEIKDCAGSQFDPELADKFIEIISSQDLKDNKLRSGVND
ncbi:MAG: HD domain-containing phosphohydrolase [Bacillota bacterium]